MTILSLFIIVLVMFLYFAGIFDSKVERLLFKERYLNEYELETFTLLNFLSNIWILMSSKEIFNLEEPHILLINKRKYIISKVIAYLMLYLIVFISIYGIYQVVLVLMYGFVKFNYLYIIHLSLNVVLIHSFIVFISGKSKSVIKMVLLVVLLFALDQLKNTNLSYLKLIHFYYPTLTLIKPNFSYLHVILVSLFYYSCSFYKFEILI